MWPFWRKRPLPPSEEADEEESARKRPALRRAPLPEKEKLADLMEVQLQLQLLDERCAQEQMEIQKRYDRLRRPLFDKRSKLLRRLPGFWRAALLGHPLGLVHPSEAQVLGQLVELDVRENLDAACSFEVRCTFGDSAAEAPTTTATTATTTTKATTATATTAATTTATTATTATSATARTTITAADPGSAQVQAQGAPSSTSSSNDNTTWGQLLSNIRGSSSSHNNTNTNNNTTNNSSSSSSSASGAPARGGRVFRERTAVKRVTFPLDGGLEQPPGAPLPQAVQTPARLTATDERGAAVLAAVAGAGNNNSNNNDNNNNNNDNNDSNNNDNNNSNNSNSKNNNNSNSNSNNTNNNSNRSVLGWLLSSNSDLGAVGDLGNVLRRDLWQDPLPYFFAHLEREEKLQEQQGKLKASDSADAATASAMRAAGRAENPPLQ